jgi:hypothetical protein
MNATMQVLYKLYPKKMQPDEQDALYLFFKENLAINLNLIFQRKFFKS